MAVFMFDLFRADPSLVVVNSELYDLQINIKSYSHPQQHIILPQVSGREITLFDRILSFYETSLELNSLV